MTRTKKSNHDAANDDSLFFKIAVNISINCLASCRKYILSCSCSEEPSVIVKRNQYADSFASRLHVLIFILKSLSPILSFASI